MGHWPIESSNLSLSAKLSVFISCAGSMRIKRTEVAIPAIKGLICGVIGGSLLALSFALMGPYSGVLPLALFLYSLPCLLAAILYTIATFLLARARAVWRVPGALLDAAASAAISWALVSTFLEGRAAYGDWPLSISIAIAAIWVGALLPVFVGAFRPTNLVTGSAGSSRR
jgi:hypothetical protein